MVNEFVRRWGRERPSSGGLCGDTPEFVLRPVSAVAFLAQESGLSRDTVRRVKEGQSSTTELRIAEPLVTLGLAEPEAFHDGRLPVLDNGKARVHRTSLNGSLAT